MLVWGLLFHTNHSSVHLNVWAWGGVVFCCGSHTCSWDEQNMTSGWSRFEPEMANILHWKQGVKIWCFSHCTTGGGNSWCMSGEIPALTKSIEKPFTDYRGTSSLSRRKMQFRGKFAEVYWQECQITRLKGHLQVYRSSLWSVADPFHGIQC